MPSPSIQGSDRDSIGGSLSAQGEEAKKCAGAEKALAGL
jgi:hypothetical protein